MTPAVADGQALSLSFYYGGPTSPYTEMIMGLYLDDGAKGAGTRVGITAPFTPTEVGWVTADLLVPYDFLSGQIFHIGWVGNGANVAFFRAADQTTQLGWTNSFQTTFIMPDPGDPFAESTLNVSAYVNVLYT